MGDIVIRHFEGLQDYQTLWQQMRQFTDTRSADTPDELWLMQHLPVFTLGQAGKPEHLLSPTKIPLIKTDRGGQITYHGPGQLMAYLLLDLKRRQMGARQMVTILEQSIIQLLAEYDIHSYARKSAPGVYVMYKQQEHKIAALGLRIRKGYCYHGLALNIDMDLQPFALINPCGYAGLPVTRIKDLLSRTPEWKDVESRLTRQLQNQLH